MVNDKLKVHNTLVGEGFSRELILWSFNPKFYDKDDGFYYSKFVPVEGSYFGDIEIGVIVNEKYRSMEVYICDCVVGCCGIDMGIHPFSLEKIDELLKDFIFNLNDKHKDK